MAAENPTTPIKPADALHRAIYQFHELESLALSARALVLETKDGSTTRKGTAVAFVLATLADMAGKFATEADLACLAADGKGGAA